MISTDTSTAFGALTLDDLRVLSAIADARDQSVIYTRDFDLPPFEGVARGFSDEKGCRPPEGTDVRDMHVRISGTVEMWIPVTEMMDAVREGRACFPEHT